MNKDIQMSIIRELKEEYERRLYEQRELSRLYRFLLISLHNSVTDGEVNSDIYNTYDRTLSQYLLDLPCEDDPNVKNILTAVYKDGSLDVEGLITSIYGTFSYGEKKREYAQKVIDLFKLIDKDYSAILENLDAAYGT